MNLGSGGNETTLRILLFHQLAFDNEEREVSGRKMNRYNELKLQVLALFASTQGEWLGPNEAAEKLDFFPARSAWTYFKRLWSLWFARKAFPGPGNSGISHQRSGKVATSLAKVTLGVIWDR